MKKIIFFIMFLLAFANSDSYAQRLRNYIYMFDCTRSMEGEFQKELTKNKNKEKKIFDDERFKNTLFVLAANYLFEDIERQTDDSEIVVIPFTNNTPEDQHIINFVRKNYSEEEVKNKLLDGLARGGNTGICNAWDKGLTYLDKSRDNYFILLTDGVENINSGRVNAVCERINNWKAGKDQNFAFYVALKTNEKSSDIKAIKNAVDPAKRTFYIEGHGFPFGTFTPNECNLNIHTLHPIQFNFSTAGSFPVLLESQNPNFDVSLVKDKIDNGIMTLEVNPKKEINDKGTFVLNVKVKSKDGKLNILNPNIKINIATKEVPNLSLREEEIDGGKCSTHGDFFFGFFEAKECDTIYVDLEAVFNKLAIDGNASFRLNLRQDKLRSSDYELLYKDQSGDIVIKAEDNIEPLKLVIRNTVKDGKYVDFIFEGYGEGLENINDKQINTHSVSLRFHKITVMNPVKKACCWFFVIVLSALILWFVVLRKIMFPQITLGSLQITYPNGEPVSRSIKNARKVIFCKKAKQQGLLNKIFTGKIVYVTSPYWIAQMEMLPGKKRTVRLDKHGAYTIDPITLALAPSQKYTLVNLKTKESFKIVLM